MRTLKAVVMVALWGIMGACSGCIGAAEGDQNMPAEPAKYAASTMGTRLGLDAVSIPPLTTTMSASVTWTNPVAIVASGATLTRSTGWGWSAGASSVEEIGAGDGYVEFSTDEANKSKMAGLSHGDNDQGYADIDYAILLRDDGLVDIYEAGGYRGTFGSYAAGDVFRVEVAGAEVRYRQNGAVFHSSAAPPTYPLVLDTSLYHGGATLTNAHMGSSGGSGALTSPVTSAQPEPGCAEIASDDAIAEGSPSPTLQCTEEVAAMGIVFSGYSESCAPAPYGYVCVMASWGVYSPLDNKPGKVKLLDVSVIRAKFDPSFSCNWSAEAKVSTGGNVILSGSTGLQESCGPRNVATWSSGDDVPKGSVACGKYFEGGTLQGSQVCTTISP